MSSYRLDRTAFKAQTVEEAANHTIFYGNLHWKERLLVTAYLNSIAFNYSSELPPRIDKTKFEVKARN